MTYRPPAFQRTAPVPERSAPLRPDDRAGHPRVTCIGFKLRHSGSLLGYAEIHLSRLRLRLHDVPIYAQGPRRWAGVPSRPVVDRENQPVRDEAGKPKYQPLLAWDTPDLQKAFSDAVVMAVEDYDASVFRSEPEDVR